MIKQIYVCDRCGAEIGAPTTAISFNYAGAERVDLCYGCTSFFEPLLQTFLQPEAAPDPKPEEKKEKPTNKQKRIDWGKACALKRG